MSLGVLVQKHFQAGELPMRLPEPGSCSPPEKSSQLRPPTAWLGTELVSLWIPLETGPFTDR